MPCPRTQQANLPVCSPQPPINAERQARKLWIPFYKAFWYDSTRGLNPRSTDCEADALTTTPSRRLMCYWECKFDGPSITLYVKSKKSPYFHEPVLGKCFIGHWTSPRRIPQIKAVFGQKTVDRNTTEEQMDMLGLKETIDRLATANGVRWYGHVLRRDDDSVLRVALNHEVTGKRKRGRPKKTWKNQVEEETEKVGLKEEDALRRDKWRDGVREIAEGMG